MDEEAQKRNTDCVYFLASPLTCKKGSECEYRHSESARINPRDCWYWIGGNCLNPHCPFRHPPLEVHPTGSVTDTSQVSGNANKNGVPCYYFFQGYCAKGDKCSFMHGPPFGTSPCVSASQKNTKMSSTGVDPQSVEKKDANKTDNGTMKPMSVRTRSSEVQLPKEVNCVPEAQPTPYHAKPDQHTPEPFLPEGEYPQDNEPELPVNDLNYVTSAQVPHNQRTDDWLENEDETEEWLEESSPGFDVLVDDGPDHLSYQDDVEYLSNFDRELGRESVRGRERLIQSADELIELDYEGMHDELGYTEDGSRYAHMPYDTHEKQAHQRTYNNANQYKRKNFGDRDSDAVFSERRSTSMERYSRRIEKADLRHRLSKHRRVDRIHMGDHSTRRVHSDTRPSDIQHGRRLWGNDQIYHHDGGSRSQQGLRQNNLRMPPRIRSAIGSFPKESFNDVEPDFEGSTENIVLRNSVSRHSSVERFRTRHKEKERGRNHVGYGVPFESSGFRRPINKNDLAKNDGDFARPKTLEQIKEEKRRASMLSNGLEDCKTTEDPKSSEQSTCGPQTVLKSQTLNKFPGEERKIGLGKAVVNESNKFPLFDGPKPLSALLKAKQKSNDDNAGESSPKGTRELSHRSDVNGNPEIGGNDTVLSCSHKEVEGKALVQKSAIEVSKEIPSYHATGSEQCDLSFQNNGISLAIEKNREDMLVCSSIKTAAAKDNPSMDSLNFGNVNKSIDHKFEPEDEEDFAMEEDEDDDFAKKIGGFFT